MVMAAVASEQYAEGVFREMHADDWRYTHKRAALRLDNSVQE